MAESNAKVSSAEKMFDVLDCFIHKNEWTLTEITQKLGFPTTTMHRILQTLEGRGFIERVDGSKRYVLGMKVGDFIETYTRGRFDLLRCAAIRPMEALSSKHNETVRLFVRDGGYKLCIEAVESTQDIRHIVKVGERHDLVRGAAGKILLAYMPVPQRHALLGEISPELEEKISKAFYAGYAVSVGEREEGLSAVAAPILSAPNRLSAVISFSGPNFRFASELLEEKIVDTVACANQISEGLVLG